MLKEHRRLVTLARRHLPPAVAERWIALMRPAVRLRTRQEGQKLVGQLGGLPALPDGLPWPEWEGEGSLGFVALIDCGRLPLDRLDIALPDSGTLLFFYFDPEDGYFDPEYPPRAVEGRNPETLAGARVIHIPAGVPTTERAAPADIDPYDHVPLTAELISTGPDWEHPALRAAVRALSDDDRAFMNGHGNSDPFRMALSKPPQLPQHRIGGYAYPVQGAVELDVAATQLGGGTPVDDTAWEKEARRWTLLAQIDTDDEAGMMWGDVGSLYWLIKPEDLAAGRFDAASFTWQCS
ncbi:DUF1963 domain-containing protein [Actinomadura alba]|uniref:DUF1963 domain-containing protein n=2 Tax=Actinomadura alba TaxID=406431 RepID=A0ABR7LXW1_9ACTN|nr:DUF1963 domain-containing protein [Actinomadura alba]